MYHCLLAYPCTSPGQCCWVKTLWHRGCTTSNVECYHPKNVQTKRNKGQGELTEQKSYPGIKDNKRQYKDEKQFKPRAQMENKRSDQTWAGSISEAELWHLVHLDNAEAVGERVFPISSAHSASREGHIWSAVLLAHCFFREPKVSSAANTSITLAEPTGACCSHLALIRWVWTKIMIYFSRKCQLQKCSLIQNKSFGGKLCKSIYNLIRSELSD